MRRFTATVDVYLTKDSIGDPEYLDRRVEITEKYQILMLRFPKVLKDSFRMKLAKSKHGVVVCSAGSCLAIDDPAQVVARQIKYLE